MDINKERFPSLYPSPGDLQKVLLAQNVRTYLSDLPEYMAFAGNIQLSISYRKKKSHREYCLSFSLNNKSFLHKKNYCENLCVHEKNMLRLPKFMSLGAKLLSRYHLAALDHCFVSFKNLEQSFVANFIWASFEAAILSNHIDLSEVYYFIDTYTFKSYLAKQYVQNALKNEKNKEIVEKNKIV